MHAKPSQAIQVTRSSVRMLEKRKPITAEIATKTAVHVPCDEMAFNPIEIPSMPDPATKTITPKRLVGSPQSLVTGVDYTYKG